MALDRPDDDLTRPERQVPGSDVPAARPEPAEWRSREEYYEALRAADGRPPEGGSSRADRSGWDSVDTADRLLRSQAIPVTPILADRPGQLRG